MTTLRITTAAVTWLSFLLLSTSLVVVVVATPVSTTSSVDIAIPCGTKVCTGGFVCCNASCSICAPKGDKCVEIFCSPLPEKRQEDVPQPGQCGPKVCGPNQRCCN